MDLELKKLLKNGRLLAYSQESAILLTRTPFTKKKISKENMKNNFHITSLENT